MSDCIIVLPMNPATHFIFPHIEIQEAGRAKVAYAHCLGPLQLNDHIPYLRSALPKLKLQTVLRSSHAAEDEELNESHLGRGKGRPQALGWVVD